MSKTIPENRILHASGVESADLSGSGVEFLSSKASAYINVTALSGTAPTITAIIEEQDVLTGGWFTIGTFSILIDSVSSQRIEISAVNSDQVRVSWTIGGSASPTVTFSVSIAGKDIR